MNNFYVHKGHTADTNLRLSLDGVHSADEFAIGLKEQQELEMEFIQPSTQLKLLGKKEKREEDHDAANQHTIFSFNYQHGQ